MNVHDLAEWLRLAIAEKYKHNGGAMIGLTERNNVTIVVEIDGKFFHVSVQEVD